MDEGHQGSQPHQSQRNTKKAYQGALRQFRAMASLTIVHHLKVTQRLVIRLLLQILVIAHGDDRHQHNFLTSPILEHRLRELATFRCAFQKCATFSKASGQLCASTLSEPSSSYATSRTAARLLHEVLVHSIVVSDPVASRWKGHHMLRVRRSCSLKKKIVVSKQIQKAVMCLSDCAK